MGFFGTLVLYYLLHHFFVVNQKTKDAEEALEYNEVSFLSNIRLNAFYQSFKQLDNVNNQLNIAFLNDFEWQHENIELRPDNLSYPILTVEPDEVENFVVIAEFLQLV